MKKMMTAMAAFTLVVGTAACTPSGTEAGAEATGLAGTWMANVDSAESENSTSNLLLADGTYTCNSCIPPFSTPADGEWQTVDRPGVDQIMVAIVDDNTVKTSTRFGGEDLGNSTWTVSEDGQSMKQEFVNLRGEEATNGDLTLKRTAAGPDGSHAISGEWDLDEYGDISDSALLTTYALDGDTITVTYNTGGYTATLGGEAVAMDGDNSGTLVAVEKVSENVYRETYTRDGETVGVTETTVDGNTLSFVSTDPRDESEFRYTATRQ